MKAKICENGVQIAVVSYCGYDAYISLTDIAKYGKPEYPGYVIKTGCETEVLLNFWDFGAN